MSAIFPEARSVFIQSAGEKWAVLREHLSGLRRRRGEAQAGDRPLPEPDRVRRFFEAKSSREGYGRVTDAGRDWYLGCISGSPAIVRRLEAERATDVLDIGCSRGSLLEWLRGHGNDSMRYLGTDLDEVAIANCSSSYQNERTDFMVENIVEPRLEADRRFNLVFCINVLSYIQDLDNVLETLVGRCVPGDGLLVIMDPVPSPYWNTVFGGFRTALRQPRELDAAVTRAGGKRVDAAVLYTLNLLGRGTLPIAAMGVWSMPAAS